MTRRAPWFALLLVPLAACNGPASGYPGEETSSCNEGRCLEGLSCLSDLCVDPDWTPTEEPQDTDDPQEPQPDPMPVAASSELDILLVVDNSGSMGEKQLVLATHVGRLVDPLVAAGLDVRIGVTTTDDSNYWCDGEGISAPEFGAFVTSSCRSRLGDFYFSGDESNVEAACTDVCALDSITLMPSGAGNDAPPWVEVNASGSNIGGGVSATEALRCLVPQGINGCGFESPLESVYKALQRSTNNNRPEAGFIRESAHLAVIIVSDEVDCSATPQHEHPVFGEEGVGNQVFWSLPSIQQSPTSAVCWNAGVTCDFSLGSDQCTAADRNVDGGPASTADDAALLPVSVYRSYLENLRKTKAPHGAEVFTFGILGVPEGYEGTLMYALGPDPENPTSFQAKFGIDRGCSSPVGEAVPPVRMRELVEQSPWSKDSQLYSVCAADWAPHLSDIADRIIRYVP